MTRQEYTHRTNDHISEEDFAIINRVYMAAGDSIDKDQFCKDFKKSGLNPTLAALTERVEAAEEKITELKRTISNLAIYIAEQAEQTSSAELRQKAIQMMGERQYLTWKIENGIRFWKADRELIKELINQ